MAYQHQSNNPGGESQLGDILIVVHDFDARSADELTLRRGDRISLVELDDGFGDGWFLGKHLSRGNTGLFPGVYTQKMAGWSSAVRISGPSVRASLPAEPEIFQAKTLNPHLGSSSSSSLPAVDAGVNSEPSKNIAPPDLSVKDTHAKNQTASTAPEVKRSSSPSRPSAASIPSIPRSISLAIGQLKGGQDSPVMNETLSVIDEHITDLSTPRHSVTAHDPRHVNDSASEYSSNFDNRVSYLAGPETDEEEDEMLSQANVKKWTPQETAIYLRQIGIDSKHCDIFEEQEISGDVLLDMDQEFIHMKEYNFGVMGRRLKTWHKIRQFQDEVKSVRGSREKSPSYSSAAPGTADDLESRIGSSGTALPRIASLMERSEPSSRHLQHTTPYGDARPEHNMPAPLQTQSHMSSGNRSNIPAGSPLSPWRASTQKSPSRPSAASIRDISHRRRRSSLEISTSPALETKGKTGSISGKFSSHKRQASFDRNWSMATTAPASHSHPDVTSAPSPVLQKSNIDRSDLSSSSEQPSADLDRGYFSGPESDPSKARKFLRKRDGTGSANHSRHSSFVDQQKRDLGPNNRHSRFGSADSIRDFVPAVASSAAQAYHSKSFKSRFRSASARTATGTSASNTLSPTVTNLEGNQSPGLRIPSRPESDASGTSSPLPPMSGKSSVKQKRFGLRAISDTVTGNERALVSSPTSIPSSFQDSPLHSPSRTGSTTPSATSRSLDIDNADASSKGTDAPGNMSSSRIPARGKMKTKKDTSAYTKGLEKKSPAEQRIDCDYSGWMKKKSSSLMTTWKPRLFFLRGRRLSYYYSEDDTQERGVIDISSHKVLRADQDPITNLHATITGSASTPAVQSPPATTNTAGSSNGRGKTAAAGAPFIFKLMPPKTGLSRAVQFTKPTIHYFQVDGVHEGRKWMAALMKATIAYDPTFGLETTNKQKTISLAKARARKERPPALMGDESVRKVPMGPKSDETGLNIRGLSFDDLGKKDMRPNGAGDMQQKMSSLEAGRSTSRTRAASEATAYRNSDRQPTTS